jgi:hypothetical protein
MPIVLFQSCQIVLALVGIIMITLRKEREAWAGRARRIIVNLIINSSVLITSIPADEVFVYDRVL